MKKAIVFGAGGFIGNHLVLRLKAEGYWVRGVDLKHPEFTGSSADEFVIGDLRLYDTVANAIDNGVDELYQLAADMGGAGYLFSGENDANVMHNSAQINLHTAELATRRDVGKLFFSSSACIYPKHNQQDPLTYCCAEDSAYPADPDSDYGWEKLFAERVYQAFNRNYGLNIRIGRFHNVYGPLGPWSGGKEKAPAAICRKVATAMDGDFIEVWGDGSQTRSFLYVDDCIDAIRRFMNTNSHQPVNIGSEEMVTIDQLAEIVIRTSGKNLFIRHAPGPLGVRSRNSDNRLFRQLTGWEPGIRLTEGIAKTYSWIEKQVKAGQHVLVG